MKEQIDPGNPVSFFSDDVCTLVTVGSVTHVIFTCREPSADSAKTFRTVQARMIVPNNCLQQIGRAILKGEQINSEGGEIYGASDSPLH